MIKIQVKSKLSLTRNPSEHNHKLNNQIGDIVHELPDGYTLVLFHHLLILNPKSKKNIPLQWYVHETELIKIK